MKIFDSPSPLNTNQGFPRQRRRDIISSPHRNESLDDDTTTPFLSAPLGEIGSMAKRPPIPADLERAILIECGHRCAIPTCRQVPLEISHIQPWSRCKTHAFENLIALCPTCHTRFDNGDIDRKSMRIYKLNLFLVSSRYGDLELRVIRTFVMDRAIDTFWWFVDMEIMLLYLLGDGVLKATNQERLVGGLVQKLYKLTVKGHEYIAQWPTN